MSDDGANPTQQPPPGAEAETSDALRALAETRQRAYAQSRREWAEAVGHPYGQKCDPRPPPGELDGAADE